MTTRIAIVGGFLGAGKANLILHAARKLAERGYWVGLVTNDQGQGLVDTALAEEATNAVTVVAGALLLPLTRSDGGFAALAGCSAAGFNSG